MFFPSRLVTSGELLSGRGRMPIAPRFSLSILQSLVLTVIAVSCNNGPDVVRVVSPLRTPPDFNAVVSSVEMSDDSGTPAVSRRLEATLLNQLEAEPGEGEPPRVILVVPKSTRVFIAWSAPSLASPKDIKVGDSIQVWRAVSPTDSPAVAVPTYSTRQIMITPHVKVPPQNARTIFVKCVLVVGCILGPWITLVVARSRRARRAAGTDTAIASLFSEALALVAGAFAFGLMGLVAMLLPLCPAEAMANAITFSAFGAVGGLVTASIGRKQGLRTARPYDDWIPGVMGMLPSALLTAYGIVMCGGS